MLTVIFVLTIKTQNSENQEQNWLEGRTEHAVAVTSAAAGAR